MFLIKVPHWEIQALYDRSLKILKANPDNPNARILAIDLGRLHYSTLRKIKHITEEDDLTIQNDISLRCE